MIASRRSAVAASSHARAAAARNDADAIGGTSAGSQHEKPPLRASGPVESFSQLIFSAAFFQSASAVPRFAAHGSYQSSDQPSSPLCPRG